MPERVQLAIIGGGLAGLTAARLLHAAGVDLLLLEARDRLVDRVWTADEAGQPSEDGFDLGASQVWPEAQPAVAALIAELGLAVMPQYGEGDVIFHRMSREAPQRFRRTGEAPTVPSMRMVGGTGALVLPLARDVPRDRFRLGARVTGLVLGKGEVHLAVEWEGAAAEVVTADQVIAALPPRLLEAKVMFTPEMSVATTRRWRDTPTWMAPHAKVFAFYDRPFWREANLSGTAQSLAGLLAEIHDATTDSGRAALLGFLGVGAGQRAGMGGAALTVVCLEQTARLFGGEARHPHATLIADWDTEPLTTTVLDLGAGGHPAPAEGAWVTGPWVARLALAGSETSPTDPGYVNGAIGAARRVVAMVRDRFGSIGPHALP